MILHRPAGWRVRPAPARHPSRVSVALTFARLVFIVPLEMRVAVTDVNAPRFGASAPARLRFTGIVLDPAASVAAPLKSSLNVLVFGDSITEGMMTISSNSAAPYNSQSNSPQSWASLLRDELGCELGAVGWSGTGYSLGSTDVPAFPSHWNLLATGISRPMTPEPDLVIVNHGTNDNTTDITVAARTVLNAMLAQWSHTRIIVLNPFLQPSGAPTIRPNPNTYLQTATRTCNDPARVTFIGTLGFYDYTKGSSPDGIHPSRSNQAGFIVKNVANAIRPYLAQRLIQRWTYS